MTFDEGHQEDGTRHRPTIIWSIPILQCHNVGEVDWRHVHLVIWPRLCTVLHKRILYKQLKQVAKTDNCIHTNFTVHVRCQQNGAANSANTE